MIEHVKISAVGKSHLVRLKGKTGIENWNILCRWAFCTSFAEQTSPRDTGIDKGSIAIEMTWKTFGGEYSEVYLALLKRGCNKLDLEINRENLETLLWLHIHRGLGYLMGKKDKSIEGVLRNSGLGDRDIC